MRRFLTILACLMLVLSCVDSKTGGQTEIVTDPVSECVVPEAVRCGDDVILQWNGFGQMASIVMRSSSGEETVAEISVITASGLIFNVPFTMLPGIYDIVLVQDGEFTLGQIEVLPPDMPVSGISMPSSALAEEVILIKGMGFDSSSRIVLVALDGTEYEIVPEYVAGGLSISLPDSLPEGEYAVVLLQDGYRWTICESFQLMSVARTLASVAYQGPYMGATQVRYIHVCQQDRQQIEERFREHIGESESQQIVLDLIKGTQGVYCLNKSRKDEHTGQQETASGGPNFNKTICRWIILQTPI